MSDILPSIIGDRGPEEVTPALLVDATGVPYSLNTFGRKALIDVTLTVTTAVLAAGEVLADTQQVANFFSAIDKGAVLESVTVIDADDQSANDMALIFLTDNVSLGTENNAPTISDANALHVQARVPIATADYTDLGGVKVATVGNLRRLLIPKVGTRDLYIGALNGAGAPTYAGGVITVRLGVSLD